ncbi:MAG: hypothetical protein ACOC1F_01375 [Myxococcota bacterium]
MKTITTIALGLAVSASPTLAGCMGGTELEPATSANQVQGMDDAATAVAAGVRITAQGDAWHGLENVTDHVTPLRVSITNNSGRALRIRYRDFVLRGSGGDSYAALPLTAIEGEIEAPTRVDEPAFAERSFYVAPHYAAAYPSMRAYTQPFAYDAPYYDEYNTYLRDIDLPTVEMVESGLPEGVIDDGGEVSGFLYFQQVPGKTKQVSFTAHLHTPEGDEIGALTIPFNTD